jgi:hypothetical protein
VVRVPPILHGPASWCAWASTSWPRAHDAGSMVPAHASCTLWCVELRWRGPLLWVNILQPIFSRNFSTKVIQEAIS